MTWVLNLAYVEARLRFSVTDTSFVLRVDNHSAVNAIFPVKDQTFHFTNVRRIDPPVTHTIKHGITAGRKIWTGINLGGYICLERHVDVMLVVSIARNLTSKLLKSCRLEFSRFLTLLSIRARRVRVGFISFKDGKFHDNLYSVQNARCVLMQKWFETLWRFGRSEARYFMTATISSPHTSCRYQILLPCLCKAPCKISFVLFSLKFDEVSQ